jgi:serine/threonine protein kinase
MRTALSPGSMIGPYVLDARLGAGSSATVWRGWRAGRGTATTPVAIKVFHEKSEAARAEATVVRALEHPNIVRLHEVLATRSGTALVFEHAAGGSLATRLARRGPLSPGQVVTLGLGVAGALRAAHERGIVHGDVHPGNVLLDGRGHVLLADFGLAASRSRGGAAGYTAPEVEQGERPSVRSDLWSLGAVCRTALGSGGPTTLVVVLTVALAPAPEARFASAADFAAALADAYDASPITAGSSGGSVAACLPARAEGPVLTRRFGPRPPAVRARQPISSKKPRRSSACSSSTARMPSIIRRVVTSLSPSQRMISL